MNWLGEIIQKNVEPEDTVLDLGCGIMFPSDELVCQSIVGVDIFPKYLDHIKNKFCTVRIGLDETDRFMNESYDVVICIDVVEHLDKDLALHLLYECRRICRKKAIIFTPIEFNNNEQNEEGAWGLGINVYQEHQCLITSAELEEGGYEVTSFNDGLLGIWSR